MESPNALQGILSKMDKPVRVLVFTSNQNCIACGEVLGIMRELEAASSGKFAWEKFSLDDGDGKEVAKQHGVSRSPTILFPDHGIRYTGAPIGMEAAPFVQTIVMASTGQTMILPDDRFLGRIKKPVSMRVIVTPTCPYCAQAVLLENSLAILSDKVRVEIVESYENPDIARQYNVTGVPVTIVDEKRRIEGVPNVALLLSHLVDDASKMNELYG